MKKVKYKNFQDWWKKVAQKKVAKIEKNWIKNNEPNDPDEEDEGDHFYVNQMMHNGEAQDATYDNAEEVFNKGRNGESWEMNMGDSLFCELDQIIEEAYEAGKINN
jgi:hypothetical protein